MLSAILSLAGPAIASSVLGPASFLAMNPMITSALGGGIGKLLEGGNQQDALQAAALGGLGSFLGGKLAGSGAGNLPGTSGALGPTAPGVTPALNPDIASKMAAAGPGAGTGLTSVPFTEALTRPEAIGAGIGASLAPPPMMKLKEEEEREMPRGMPIKNTSIFPEMGYDAGKMGEFNYRIPKNFAEGGEIESDIMPMDAGIGGMMNDGMNDKELISSTIDVLQGEIIDTDRQSVILAQFVAQFGQEALQDLINRVESGEIPDIPREGDGMVSGAGDGMADMIPASMEGDQDVLLSDGEFVVPADVVSGLGNGSSDAGANKLEDMMDRVRELRTGGKTQPPAIPDEMMLPA
tara:strand:+ start:140 stop:1192 length:1053 start_codon:yes stop_codon:yes gene_type:complete